MPSYMVLGSLVPELQHMRMVCLLQAVTPAWVTNTVSLTIVVDYVRYRGSFEVLQAMVKCLLSVGPAHLVPRTLNKHYFARFGRSMYL